MEALAFRATLFARAAPIPSPMLAETRVTAAPIAPAMLRQNWAPERRHPCARGARTLRYPSADGVSRSRGVPGAAGTGCARPETGLGVHWQETRHAWPDAEPAGLPW